jgi:hypothetical protein
VELHLNQSIAFKIRKVGRYLALFGPSRTLVKIKGHRETACGYAGSTVLAL